MAMPSAIRTRLDATSSSPPFPFMKLPIELRLQIYNLAIQETIEHAFRTSTSVDGPNPKYLGALALAHTSSTMRAESVREMLPVVQAEYTKWRRTYFAIWGASVSRFMARVDATVTEDVGVSVNAECCEVNEAAMHRIKETLERCLLKSPAALVGVLGWFGWLLRWRCWLDKKDHIGALLNIEYVSCSIALGQMYTDSGNTSSTVLTR